MINPFVIVGKVSGQSMVNIQKPWDIIRQSAGLRDFRLHNIRHSFASIAGESGASLSRIGKLLGHKKSATTERYSHLADNPIKDLNNDVGRSLASSLKL